MTDINNTPDQAVPDVHPLAWLVYLPAEQAQRVYDDQDDTGYVDDVTNNSDAEVTPLYAAPPSPAHPVADERAAQPLTPDEARWAATHARNLNGPSDSTSPAEYVMAGARAAVAKAAQTRQQVREDARAALGSDACACPQGGCDGSCAPYIARCDDLPARDTSKPAEAQGLFRKFEVRRADGSDAPGGKHYGCRYFVLDVDHDAHAAAALTAYAAACAQTHPELAEDDDGLPVGYADWYNQRFFGETIDTKRDHDCEAAWRAALAAQGSDAPRDFAPAFADGVLSSREYHDLWTAPTADRPDHGRGPRFAWHIGAFAERVAARAQALAAQPSGQTQPVSWAMTASDIQALAAELVDGAMAMGDDEDEDGGEPLLVLTVARPCTVRDDDGALNTAPVLTIHLGDYPDEGVYPIDPASLTHGGQAPAVTTPGDNAPQSPGGRRAQQDKPTGDFDAQHQ